MTLAELQGCTPRLNDQALFIQEDITTQCVGDWLDIEPPFPLSGFDEKEARHQFLTRNTH